MGMLWGLLPMTAVLSAIGSRGGPNFPGELKMIVDQRTESVQHLLASPICCKFAFLSRDMPPQMSAIGNLNSVEIT